MSWSNWTDKHTQSWKHQYQFQSRLSCPLPLAAVGDRGHRGNVLLQSEDGVQGAVPRVDKCELVEACTINGAVSIRRPHKTVLKEMWIILDCVLFAVNGYCRSQQCGSICTSLRDLESVTRWIHATHSTPSSVNRVTWVNKMCLVFFFPLFLQTHRFFSFKERSTLIGVCCNVGGSVSSLCCCTHHRSENPACPAATLRCSPGWHVDQHPAHRSSTLGVLPASPAASTPLLEEKKEKQQSVWGP